MILNRSESRIVSSLGWVDAGAIWLCETATGAVSSLTLSGAKYLSLHPGRDDHFAVLHHFEAGRLEISVHGLEAPESVRASLVVAPGAPVFRGDAEAWAHVPRAYVASLAHAAGTEFSLLLIDRHGPAVEIQRFDWYDESYDKMYQGITGVTEVPGEDSVIVSVQRDSQPVLYDPVQRRLVRKLSLANRGRFGNAECRFRRTVAELWVSDYDTLLCLDSPDWTVRHSRRLQGAAAGVQQFIGAFTFNRNESLCAVARPYSGDVVALNTQTFRVTHRAGVGHQPLKVALLADGRVFARDWKSGNLLAGRLRRRLFSLGQ